MRIAIVGEPYVPVPPPKYGGREQVIHYLIQGLMELGHEPIYLGSGDSNVDCELIPICDKAIYFPKSKKDLPTYNERLLQIRVKIENILRELIPNIDIIHSHEFDLINFQDFPSLTTIHNEITLDRMDYYTQRKNLNWISISNNQRIAHPHLNYISTVYNGENPDEFPVVETPDDYVCFLGRFDRDKSPHMALELAINMGIKIKVAGKIDHKGEGYFDYEVARYFEHPLVEYLGELDFKHKVELISRAKCNLHPTNFREAFGLTVIEAAYCGTPTLALARGSMPEIIENNYTGLIVEDFAEGFHRINECFAMNRKYIARKSRLRFNYRKMTRQYLRTYKKVIADFKIQKSRLK